MKIIGEESSCSTDRIRPTEKAYSQSVFYCHKLAERAITPGGDRRGVRLFCIQIICNLPRGTEHYYETL